MKKYNLINNICGWFCFLVAAIVYLLTIEPTASFWDCGEFISSAYKLEVGHPPGAPFFMITGNLFTQFASDPTQVAVMVNAMSALLSAATILFLFWTITCLVRKLVYTDKSKEMTLAQLIVIMGSGLVGALVYTFTDTFWFSAVEGEVYAYSSMFTALVFWLILKWENRADQLGSDKWLVLIAYAMGLSIGVHLLNLLCIPAIGLVYYYKKASNPNLKGSLLALTASGFLIVVLMYGIIPGFTKVGGWFELLFVNQFGLSYNSGVFFYIALILGIIAWGLYETISKKGTLKKAKIAMTLSLILSGAVLIGDNALLWVILIAALIAGVVMYKKLDAQRINTVILCLLVILIGYSSFALIPIRSIANTPMDQNSPEHVFSLASYLNREQYGDRPLFYGRTYVSDVLRDENGRALEPASQKESYDKIVKDNPEDKDRYYVASTIPSYKFDNEMLFPRMYSNVDRHLTGYRIWGGVSDTEVKPTFFQNMEFFFRYQLNYMYFRYFMWNFSGRQNDIQGTGGISNGNWITGIGFIDELLGNGPQDNLPPDIADNKGHNVYYAIPFLLGIIGILYQVTRGRRGEEQFIVTFMLFFMTGIAIILYLNQQPFEPRERDYAYAGSFYAYCIWIGLAVAAIWNFLTKKIKGADTVLAVAVSVILLLVPVQMACQNWDDHDRSNRYTMRDFAYNYLDSCEPNSILFTNGDNDTFPLWYAQEVEGYRTDVRVCNLSYLQTDWYVEQMRRQAYDSEALPINWEPKQYMGDRGASAYLLSRKELEDAITAHANQSSDNNRWGGYINYSQYFDTAAFRNIMPLDEALNILKNNENYAPRNPFINSGVVLPSRKFSIPIDSAAIDWNALGVEPRSEMVIDLDNGRAGIYRQDIMIMEMLNSINKDNWKRPIYYALTIGDYPLNINNHLILNGIVYRITPGEVNANRVDTKVMYDNVMNKFKWGNANDPKIYLDENTLRLCRTFRLTFTYLISALMEEGQNDKALLALDKCMEVLPGNTIPRGQESLVFANAYYELGQEAKGDSILNEIYSRADRTLQWYARLDQNNMVQSSVDIREHMTTMVKSLDVISDQDKNRYNQEMNHILSYMETFMKNGVVFDNRSHPLDYIYYMIAMGQRINTDSASQEQYKTYGSKVLDLMNRYDQSLLQKYMRQQ